MAWRLLPLVMMACAALASMYTCDAAWCTPEEVNAFAEEFAKTPKKCGVLSRFEICDDDCLQAIETRAKLATDCKAGSLTHREMVLQRIDKCRVFRANATYKYIPQPSPGLPSCEYYELQSWESKYGAGYRADSCLPEPCSEECATLFQEGVTMAPACSTDGYSLGEYKKSTLWRCLMSLGKNPLKNKVMLSVVHANGSVTTNTATVSTSAPPTSNYSTARTKSPDESALSLPPSSVDGGQQAPTSGASVAVSGVLMAVVMTTASLVVVV